MCVRHTQRCNSFEVELFFLCMVVFQCFHLTKRINPSKRPNQWYLNGISIYCTSIIALRIFSCLCFLDMILCLFLIRSPCRRCIVCEMLNSPNDQVGQHRVWACLFFALHELVLLCLTLNCVVMLVLHP